MTLKETLENAKGEALTCLEQSVKDRNMNPEYVRELAYIHSDLCFQYYQIVKEEIEQRKKYYDKLR